jgi:SPP1 family phage portal protein
MDIINAQIEYGAKGTENKEITQNILNEWRHSQLIKDMMEAEMYSKVQNTNIDKKTRSYQDEDGHIITNDTLSNVKSKTAQYRKSLNQKLNFALAKPFVISCDNDKYKEQWDLFLNDVNRKVIKRTGKNGINKGIGWIYPWIDENGNFRIVDMTPETIYPAWSDVAHTELDAIVRDYNIVEYNNQTPTNVTKVEFWDREIVEKYIDYSQGEGNGALEVDNGNGEYELGEGDEERVTIQQTHMKKADGSGISWDRVPFIFLKGNDDELPLLNECKTDVDAYDMLKSKGIDSLIDDIDAVLVVEDISAEMGEITKARKMVQNSRIMAVDKGGNAHFEKVNADVQALVQQLDLIRKDIQDNTSTVDLTTIQLGTNPSGKSMRAFYESLNTWANGFESEFRVMMENLKYFFDKWLSWKGGFGTFEQLQAIDIVFTLDRDMMIDEAEIIDNIVKLGDELSQETKDELNPYVDDPEKEAKRREEDKKKALEDQELFGFQNDVDNTEETDEENEDNNQKEEDNNKKEEQNQ